VPGGIEGMKIERAKIRKLKKIGCWEEQRPEVRDHSINQTFSHLSNKNM